MKTLTSLALIACAPVALYAHSHDGHSHACEADVVCDSISSEFTPMQVVPGWGVNGNSVPMPAIGSTHGGVVVDQTGLIYVSSRTGLYVFNADGKLVKAYTDDAYTGIHAMCINVEDGQEYIYGARNYAGEAIKLTTSGEIVLHLTFPEDTGIEGKFKPTAIAVKPNGNILLADGYGTNMIFEYDVEGNYLSHFGGKNPDAEDKFNTPHGLAIDYRYDPPRILIADREKMRLVHFTLDGKYIGEVITGLRRPCAVSFRGDGTVAIAELQSRVAILDKDNQLIGTLGDNPNNEQWATYKVAPEDWQEGIFTAPHGLSWDKQGNLYVQDWNETGRLTKWVESN